MHYRTIAIGISAAVLLLILLADAGSAAWFVMATGLLVPALLMVLVIGILRAKGYEQDPPPRNKWYHF